MIARAPIKLRNFMANLRFSGAALVRANRYGPRVGWLHSGCGKAVADCRPRVRSRQNVSAFPVRVTSIWCHRRWIKSAEDDNGKVSLSKNAVGRELIAKN